MAQDVVGGGGVEIEVRQEEVEEILAALELQLVTADLQHDFAILRAVDLIRRHALHEIDGLGDASLQLVEGLFRVCIRGDVDAGEAGGATLGLIGHDLDLARQRDHVRREAVSDKDGRVDLALLAMRRCLVENGGNASEHLEHERDRSLMHVERHGVSSVRF